MNIKIKVPPMGESVVQATVSRLIKETGATVRQDEEILELETDKVNQVLYAPQSGELSLSVKVGDTVKIGQELGFIQTDVQPPTAPPPKPVVTPTISENSARKTAVETVAELKAPPPPPPATSGDRKRMSSLRRTIAQRLVEVKNTTAMLTTFNEVDMSKIIAIRAEEQQSFQKRYGVKLGFMSFFVKATVAALKAYPQVHAYIEGEEIVQFPNFDIGVAVSTDKGLFVPVVRGCASSSFGEIEKQIEIFASKAREGAISVDELRGGCFTITNGGIFGSLLSTPILNPPQSGILGMHAIQKRPVAAGDEIAIRPMMYLALSYDHRLIDGREAVLFLVHLKENLEDPARLLLDI